MMSNIPDYQYSSYNQTDDISYAKRMRYLWSDSCHAASQRLSYSTLYSDFYIKSC